MQKKMVKSQTVIENNDGQKFTTQLLDRPVNPVRNWTPYVEKLIKRYISDVKNAAVYNRGKIRLINICLPISERNKPEIGIKFSLESVDTERCAHMVFFVFEEKDGFCEIITFYETHKNVVY